MLQLEREYRGFALNTATSDAQTKKIGSDEPASADAHRITNKKKTEVFPSLALPDASLFYLFYCDMGSTSNACHCSPMRAVPISYSGALFISGTARML
jgi:hypothetical protein